jgi:hypothetical protein
MMETCRRYEYTEVKYDNTVAVPLVQLILCKIELQCNLQSDRIDEINSTFISWLLKL